jgi:hypothetical protein
MAILGRAAKNSLRGTHRYDPGPHYIERYFLNAHPDPLPCGKQDPNAAVHETIANMDYFF